MKVIDVLTESKKTNEGPIRFLKRTLGKNTATGKAAQLDAELDKEVNDLYKDFFAVAKQRPDLGGMTAKGLGQFMVSKGFANKPSEVMRFINQDPGMSRTLAKGAKKVAKGAKAAAGAAGKAAKMVSKGMGKVAGATKQALTPKKSDLTPDGQMELPLSNSIYSEAVLESILNEVDIPLTKAQVKQVMKGFVRKGFQSQLGQRTKKSAYATDAGDDNMMPDDEIQNAVNTLKNAGFKIDTKSKKIKTPA
tara:strand:+ start:323 stop:1069 length:747 start_codon:yes stop_codon:yes gene_type:complete